MSKLYKIRIKKDDTVIVRSGKYKGKTGKVISTQPSADSLKLIRLAFLSVGS